MPSLQILPNLMRLNLIRRSMDFRKNGSSGLFVDCTFSAHRCYIYAEMTQHGKGGDGAHEAPTWDGRGLVTEVSVGKKLRPDLLSLSKITHYGDFRYLPSNTIPMRLAIGWNGLWGYLLFILANTSLSVRVLRYTPWYLGQRDVLSCSRPTHVARQVDSWRKKR